MHEFTLTLNNGKEYEFKFTNRSIYKIEKHFGRSALSMLSDLASITAMETIAVFLQHSVQAEKWKLEDAIDLIPMGRFNELSETLINNLVKAYGIDPENIDAETGELVDEDSKKK